MTACDDAPKHGLPLYAYGTSYLGDDTSNTAGRRYIEQLNVKLRPDELHNFGKDGATVDQVATSVADTWQSRNAIVVVDALTNNIFQTRADPADGILAAEPVMRAMLVRLGAVPTIIVMKQPHFSTRDQELFSGQLPNSIVDQWNAMIDRTVAGLPNIKVVDPNVGWDADTMMTNLHPNDLGEDHIAQQLFTTLGLS